MHPRLRVALALPAVVVLVGVAGCKKGPLGCDIIIFPNDATIVPGGSVSFAVASSEGTPVPGRTFSTVGGGTVDNDGHFVAPAAPGDYFINVSYTPGGSNSVCTAQAHVRVVAPVVDAGTDAGVDGGSDAGPDAGVTEALCVPSLHASGVNGSTAAIDINAQFDGGCLVPSSFDLTVGEPFPDGGSIAVVDFHQTITPPRATVATLGKNKPYIFAANGIGFDGGFGPISAFTDPLTLLDPPAPPTNLQVLGTGTDFVLIGFTAATGQPAPVTTQFLLDTGPGNGFVNQVPAAQTSNTAQLSGLPPAPLFHLEAVSTYANGEQSAVAGPIAFTLHPAPAPATNLFADGGVHSVFLTWSPPSDAGAPDASIVSYEIDSSNDSASWNSAGSAAGTASSALVSFIVADAGVISFRVIASNQFGAGPPSNVVSAHPLFPAPAVPNSGLVARPGTNQLGLKWKQGGDGTGATASSFNVYINDGGLSGDQLAAFLDGGTFATVIPGLSNGVGYNTSIEAKNADGVSARTNFPKVTPAPWNELSLSNLATRNKGAAGFDGGVMMFGGLTGQVFSDPASNKSYYSTFDPDGYVTQWKAGPLTAVELSSMASAGVFADAGFIPMALGGLGSDGGVSLSNLFDVAGAESSAALLDGGYAPWILSNTTPAAPARHDMGAASYNEHVYVVGGIDTSGTIYDDVQHASITAGSLGSFAVQTWRLPTARYGAAAVAYGGQLYVIGGSHSASGPVLSDVLVAPINSDGSIGTGVPTLPLPSGRFLAGAAAWNGWLYVTSGATNANESGTLGDVLIGTILSNGTIGSWTVNPNPLPQLNGAYLRSPALIENGYLYLFGWQYFAFAHLDPTWGTIGNPDGGPQSP